MSKKTPSINQVLFFRMRSDVRTGSSLSDYARFEAEKSIWASQHPDATPEHYETAIRTIAKACGVCNG